MSEVVKVLKALKEKDDDEVVVWGNLGTGIPGMKFMPGTTAGEIKRFLRFFFSDLAVDLGVKIDIEKLANEIF